jgi:hypothetical protein
MQKYADTDRDSGVDLFEISDTAIKVIFKSGPKVYVYTYTKPGQVHVEEMKKYALAGEGLNAYINSKIKSNFSHKE